MITTVDELELYYLQYIDSLQQEDMKNVQLCRDYYQGEQVVFLTERMKEFLQLHKSAVTFRLNICKTIVAALMDELTLEGFTTSEDGESKPVAQWAADVYRKNKLDEMQERIHEAALVDRETFVIVEWDEEKKYPRIVHNELFVDNDMGINGNAYGCVAIYSESNPNELSAVVKQWVETVVNSNGQPRTRRRRTVYYPDRIERFFYDSGWKEYVEDGQPFPVPLTDGSGKPIGINVAHFRNNGDQSEIWEVIPNQDVINKIALDVLGISDMSSFSTIFVSGFEPVDANGDPIQLEPMQMWGTTNADGNAQKMDASDVTPIVNTLMSWVALTANLTGTPVSRFIMSGQIAGSETLKEQDKPLQKKAARRRVSLGNSWEEVMNIARRFANAYGAAGLDEDVAIESNWRMEYTPEQLNNLKEYGVPPEFIWAKAGLSKDEIDAIKETDEYRINLKSKIWQAVGASNAEPVPAESILSDFGYSPEELAQFATQRMNAIALAQADVLPEGIDDGNATA